MDNNISDLINKALSNPETLEKVGALLPVVSNLMGENGRKIIETSVLPDKQKDESVPKDEAEKDNSGQSADTTATAQQAPPTPSKNSTSSTSSIPIETLIANENVRTAFGNLIAAISEAQNKKSAAIPAFAEIRSTSSPTDSDKDNANGTNASSTENLLKNLLETAAVKGNSAVNGNETTDDIDDNSIDNGNVEKALGALQKFSGLTSPEKDDRVKLLLALKPFLKDHRRGKIDTAIKYMSVAKILNLFGKNGFV